MFRVANHTVVRSLINRSRNWTQVRYNSSTTNCNVDFSKSTQVPTKEKLTKQDLFEVLKQSLDVAKAKIRDPRPFFVKASRE